MTYLTKTAVAKATQPAREDFSWLNVESETFLRRGYLVEGVSPIDRVYQIASTAAKYLDKIPHFEERFLYHMGRGNYSLSTPIWTNFGLKRGLPISCFGNYVDDSIAGILDAVSEVGNMSKYGGGTSSYWGDVRHRGAEIKNNGTSNGSYSFLPLIDTTIDVISQGTHRRGQHAAYIEVDHPDLEEWLGIQTEGNPIQLVFYGVCIGRKWMADMVAGDVEKRRKWGKVLESRSKTGIPYLFFKDNANDGTVDVYKDKGIKIKHTNLCTEVMLPDDKDESFVCDLASLNLLHYDEWKDSDAPEIMTYFLDAVMTDFINKTESIPEMHKARRFAIRHRALGVGVLGWHSYLQSKSLSFESFETMQINARIFKNLQAKTLKGSEELVHLYDYEEPELLKGYGRRNTTLMTLPPTKSSSFILGQVSASIEPIKSNYKVRDLQKIKSTERNPFLNTVLKDYGRDSEDTWGSILDRNGSVQHFTWMADHHKDVFKTFGEISQLAILQQAAQRQQFIDQGQSINVMVHPSTSVKDINLLHLEAERLGLKSLYYQYSINSSQELARNLMGCKACEG